MELAFDLCTLALYDIAIYADDSTSMKFAEGMLQSVWPQNMERMCRHKAPLLLTHSILVLMMCSQVSEVRYAL